MFVSSYWLSPLLLLISNDGSHTLVDQNTLFRSNSNRTFGFSYFLNQTNTEFCVSGERDIISCFPNRINTTFKSAMDSYGRVNLSSPQWFYREIPMYKQDQEITIDFPVINYHRVNDIISCNLHIPLLDICVFYSNTKQNIPVPYDDIEQFPINGDYSSSWTSGLHVYISNNNRKRKIYSKGFNIYTTYADLPYVPIILGNIKYIINSL